MISFITHPLNYNECLTQKNNADCYRASKFVLLYKKLLTIKCVYLLRTLMLSNCFILNSNVGIKS